MFGGKTSELFSILRKYALIGKKVVLIRHESDDQRHSSKRSIGRSHDGTQMIAISETTLAEDPINMNPGVEVIGIDEGQFFPHLLEFCLRWRQKGALIYISALNAKADNTSWPEVDRLYPRVDNIIFKHGICIICGDDQASRSKNIVQITNKDGVMVGGDESYVSMCSRCQEQDKEVTEEHLRKRREGVMQSKSLFI
jgi:thymidine kinase